LAALSAAGISSTPSLADFPSPSIGGVSRGQVTSPQQTAATITDINEVAPDTPPATIASQAATLPTVVAQPKSEPARALSTPAAATPAAVIQPASKTSPLIFVGIGAVVLLLILGVGGYFIVSIMKKPAAPAQTETPASAVATEVAAGHEVGRYWLELNTQSNSVRADQTLTLPSGQQFKFHFSPSENGYLYIIGPGNKNLPTTFLTAQPEKDYGVDSNEIKSGEDFSFPANTSKEDIWLNLDQAAGTDEFTFVFSSKPLTTPAFLAEPALHELSESEQKEFEDLVNQSKANVLGTEVIKTGSSPFLSVKVPQTAAQDAPVIFKIRIEHQ
jgi:hypothetical protein